MLKSNTYITVKFTLTPEVGDRDDDQDVESHCEQRDAGKQNVQKNGLIVMLQQLPTGGVEELWKAELLSIQVLHEQKGKRR